MHAIQTQSYGAAARGGAARSDVIIDNVTIVYPQATRPDIMAAFTNQALEKYLPELKKTPS
jgi:2-oxoglutarate ferredoxin oxidoreductase subunit gamma